ncbi:ATP-dependent DNA helicase [Granulicoccus phenolivorans]|uniref:ATP-dependent DNA helicase n=1 Tax=Granulicoccus phenolivorans TaxID=266854 RepID=UPI0009DBC43D|nr:ATP-dependent DNA helicase [Granulicoccus phenolivorans]
MADAVATAMDTGQHQLIQAGTGTGKSLGYLAPALIRAVQHPQERIVVATATLALQAQLAHKDIPAALDAVEEVTGQRPRAEILKGRSNYACLLRIRDQVAEQETLWGPAPAQPAAPAAATGAGEADSALGAEVLALRTWAESQASEGGLADRDDAPPHGQRAWSQVSVPVRECLGAQRCPYGQECFVEASRDRARLADLVVTNHALLAIDAMHGHTALPEHDTVIIDEAHELISRVTGAASAELSPMMVERVARRAMGWLEDDVALDFLEAGDVLRVALDNAPLARVTEHDSEPVRAFEQLRDIARRAVTGLSDKVHKDEDPERRQAGAAVQEIFDVAERLAGLADLDVVYIAERERAGREVRVSPLSVAGLMREHVLGNATTVLTSATLQLGGDFGAVAGSVGLRRDEQADRAPQERVEPGAVSWRGLDVGSPFDYGKQGICYVARHLPPPGRDGIAAATLAEITELVSAAGGRTLGLFASQRSAQAAAEHVRAELPELSVLCQGEAQLPELTKRFIAEPSTSLFGTLSLWQGVDVPGETCQLVIIDKIPFPRPDDPLLQARQQAVAEAGGNGFMSVAATHAALLLAQGAGRLIRRHTDRGVVAVLDPRLVTARYGGFLRASMPAMWMTTDHAVAISALRRLIGAVG